MRTTAADIIDGCSEALSDVLHSALDQSAAFAVIRLTGAGARALLAAGCGIDVRPQSFTAGMVCRTRLAMIPAVLSVHDGEVIEIFVDRSYGDYLLKWLADMREIQA